MVYLTIYCAKYPADLSKLTSYMSSVKLLNSKQGDFLYYDQEFRFLRYKRNIPWDEVHAGLWLECKERGPPNQGRAPNTYNQKSRNNNSFRAPQGSRQNNQNKVKVPYGFCFAFHNKGECKWGGGCTYLHKCFNYGCTGAHPIARCPTLQSGSFSKLASAPKGPAGANSPGNPNKN